MIMSGLVFLDVVWRLSAVPPSSFFTPLIMFLSLGVFVFYGTKRSGKIFQRMSVSLAVTLLLILSVWALPKFFPSGFPYAQRLALCLFLWVGMLGASMAVYQGAHLKTDIFTRLLPSRFQGIPIFVTALFCFFLFCLGFGYCYDQWSIWVRTGGARFEVLAVPYWTVSLAIPLSMLVMTFRFVRQAVSVIFQPAVSSV